MEDASKIMPLFLVVQN